MGSLNNLTHKSTVLISILGFLVLLSNKIAQIDKVLSEFFVLPPTTIHHWLYLLHF